ncbi:MAG: GNAT family N-acetyltransferase [Firmicutes bacterium]|nr:GNAT family N-acetyltransferase [Bacillota bacterium]
MDIYFEYNYGKLYEKIENGKCEVFNYEDMYGKIEYMFIKRRIPFKYCNEDFFDITTPYGYGGPRVVESINNKKILLDNFSNAFREYCITNNIVSEFVRFHPLINNVNDFEEFYEIEFNRKTIGTNLKISSDPIQDEFSKSCRKEIRKALNNEVTFNVITDVKREDLEQFKEIYFSTMERNQAAEYYYFDDNYFDDCLIGLHDNILLVEACFKNKVIAMGLYFQHGKFIHAHLSGTLTEYLNLSPAYVLKYALAKWGKENEFDIIHYGGGKTNLPDDKLYRFKKKFGQNTEFDFFIGKKVWNQNIYSKLCEIVNSSNDSNYFPAYRI